MEIIKEYWFLISGVIIPVATYLVGYYKNKVNKKESELDAMKLALLAIAQSILSDKCEQYRANGYCSYETKQTLTNLYNGYHALGGDSFITVMYKDCMKLPDIPVRITKEG